MTAADAPFDLTNLLCGLAWLGELDRAQIQRLWFPGRSASTVEKLLSRLRKDRLIAPRAWSVRDTARNVTVPRLATWSLTPRGHQRMRGQAAYPDRPMRPRQARLREHDARTAETVVRLLEIARPYGLAGVCVRHEVQIDLDRPRPTCDALVVLRLAAAGAPGNRVPWERDPQRGTTRLSVFAVESDNATETAEMLRWKGRAYAQMDADDAWQIAWQQRYGATPLPIWVAPSAARSAQIHALWRAAWPAGTWLSTDDAGLAENRWQHYRDGEERTIALFFPPQRPASPPPSAAPSAQPPRVVEERPQPPAHQLNPAAAVSAVRERTPAPPPLPTPPTPPRTPPPAAPAHLPDPPATPPLLVSAAVDAAHVTQPAPSGWKPAHDTRHASAAPSAPAVRASRAVWQFCAEFLADWGGVTGPLLGLAALILAAWLSYTLLFQPQLDQLATAVAPTSDAQPTTIGSPTPTSCGDGTVTATGVRLRAAPGLSAPTVRTLALHERLKRLCDERAMADGYTWQRVAGADGRAGWMVASWLEPAP